MSTFSTVTIANPWEQDHPVIHPKNTSEYRCENSNDFVRSGRSEETLRHAHHRDANVTDESERNEGQDEKPPSDDEVEKGGAGKEQKPVGFFHSKLNKVRLEALLMWARTSEQLADISSTNFCADSGLAITLMAFILAVMSMYWAVLSHVEKNIPSLIVYVVDFDGQVAPYNIGEKPVVGPQVVQSIENMQASPGPHLGYGFLPPSAFNNDPMQVREAVYQNQAWAAIIVNANATALLRAAVAQGNASYDPLGACQLIYIEARDQTTYPEYIIPELTRLQTDVTSKFGQMWAGMVMKNTTIPRQTLQVSPQALSPAIGFSTFNLRPFGPAKAIPTVNIGLIYLIILAYFSFPFLMGVHVKFMIPKGHPPLHFWQLIIWRWIATIVAYFFMSLAYSFVSLAFQIPLSNQPAPHTEVALNPNAYGRATFVVYWMINFVGMCALGLVCENVAMLIGQPWMALWLIFWVITNVSTAFYAIELSPRFYYWGYAWPLHNSMFPPLR